MDDLRLAGLAINVLSQRRSQDGLYIWQPHEKQRPFCESTKQEAWMLSANRSGKSDALAAILASHARFGQMNPRAAYAAGGRIEVYDRAMAIWSVSLSYALGKESFQPKLFEFPGRPPSPNKPFIPEWEIKRRGGRLCWHETRQVLELKNGSVIFFKSCDQDPSVFQAAERDLITFDEAPPKDVYDECCIRLPAGTRRLMIRGAATLLPPEGMVGGVSWLYSEKCQPWMEGKMPDLDLFEAAIGDNPHIPKGEIAKLETRFIPGTPMHRIRILGEWLPGIAGTRAYPAFDRRIHVDRTLGPQSRSFRFPLIWNIDWNVEPMGTTVWQRVREEYLGLDEITLEQGSIPELADEFKRRYPTHGAELWLHGDATGRFRSAQSAKSNWTILCECLKKLPYPYRLYVPETNPSELDRINALNAVLRGPSHGESRMKMSEKMRDTIADLELVLLAKDGSLRKSSKKADPYCRRTSWTDGMGYMVCWHDPVQMVTKNWVRRIKNPSYRMNARR